MRYVALFTGNGEGCDYSIACNRAFEVFEVDSEEAAVKRCYVEWEDHGGSRGEPGIESIQLFAIDREVSVSVAVWNEAESRQIADEEAASELEQLQARVRELKARKR